MQNALITLVNQAQNTPISESNVIEGYKLH